MREVDGGGVRKEKEVGVNRRTAGGGGSGVGGGG